MTYCDFEYDVDELSAFEIENAICSHCGIDYADKSSIPSVLHDDECLSVSIHAIHSRPYKHISCNVRIAYDGKRYTVSIYGIRSM